MLQNVNIALGRTTVTAIAGLPSRYIRTSIAGLKNHPRSLRGHVSGGSLRRAGDVAECFVAIVEREEQLTQLLPWQAWLAATSAIEIGDGMCAVSVDTNCSASCRFECV